MPHRQRIKNLERSLKPKPAFRIVVYDPALPETMRLPDGVVEGPDDLTVLIASDVAKVS